MTTKKLDSFTSSIASKKTYASPHQKFAEKSQMMRWFNERSTKELKAMQAALLTMQAARGGAK
jgi:hypothetical protein